MSVEENKEIARLWFDARGRRDLQALVDLLSDDYRHNQKTGTVLNRQQLIDFCKKRWATHSKGNTEFDDMMAEDDRVALWWPSMGKDKTRCWILRISEGKIAESWTRNNP